MIYRKIATVLNNYSGFNIQTVLKVGTEYIQNSYYLLQDINTNVYYTDKPILIDELLHNEPSANIKFITNNFNAYNKFKFEYDCLFIPHFSNAGISHYYKGFDIIPDDDVFTLFSNSGIVTNYTHNEEHLKNYYDKISQDDLKLYMPTPEYIDSYQIDVSAEAKKYVLTYLSDYSNIKVGTGVHALTKKLIILEHDMQQENFRYMRYFMDYPFIAYYQWEDSSFYVPTFIFEQYEDHYNLLIDNGYLDEGSIVGSFKKFNIIKSYTLNYDIIKRSFMGELITDF